MLVVPLWWMSVTRWVASDGSWIRCRLVEHARFWFKSIREIFSWSYIGRPLLRNVYRATGCAWRHLIRHFECVVVVLSWRLPLRTPSIAVSNHVRYRNSSLCSYFFLPAIGLDWSKPFICYLRHTIRFIIVRIEYVKDQKVCPLFGRNIITRVNSFEVIVINHMKLRTDVVCPKISNDSHGTSV